jgi:NAD(P)-dependent dehydrogenase (short-subunit alcohol dehydrogenase family)
VRCAGTEHATRNVHVNEVASGFFRTPRLHQSLDEAPWMAHCNAMLIVRTATPVEIGGDLLFLASDLSVHMASEIVIVVDSIGVMAAVPCVTFAPSTTLTP